MSEKLKCVGKMCGGKGIPDHGYKTCQSCRDYQKETVRRYRERHPEKSRKSAAQAIRMSRRKARIKVMELYGGQCACCGESTYEFLTIDHINKNGAEHRAALGLKWNTNSNFYRRLLTEERRDDLQILCANCHNAKDLFGQCPHQTGQSIKQSFIEEIESYESIKREKKADKVRRRQTQVLCACGCGKELPLYDSRGRLRSYIRGHRAKE